jgi:hypothetical protein
MARGRPVKEFQEYIVSAVHTHSSQQDYIKCPATAFLKQTVEAKSSIDLVVRTLPKKLSGEFTTDSRDTIQHLILATLPTIIGHFETFQRYLFAGTFDLTVLLSSFDTDQFARKLAKDLNVSIDLKNLSSYRSVGSAPIGRLISDNLPGWQDPEKVNRYYKLFFPTLNLFTSADCVRLKTLYQLRHSIVHTGGTLSLPDAQKIESLKGKGDTQLAFENNFIFEVSRKMHPIVRDLTYRLRDEFIRNLSPAVTPMERSRVDEFFEVSSSLPVWLK